MPRASRRPRLAYLSGLSLLLAACGGSTSPATPPKLADAARTATQLSSVAAPAATGIFRSFTLLTPYFFAPDSVPITPARPLALPRLGRWQALPFTVLIPLAAPRSQRIAAALFPPGSLGKTFVWDTTTKRYVASSDAGAPANGVRVVLYAIAPGPIVPARPSVPLVRIGYVDLTDRSAASQSVLGVTLIGTDGLAPVTYADYTITAPLGGSGSQESLAGFVTDGRTRLDLTSGFSSTLASLTTHTTADVASQDVHLVETASIGGTTTADIALDLSLTSGGETVRGTGTFVADATAQTGGGSFAVSVNGRPFATVTLGLLGFTYSGAPGVTLDAADRTALDELVGAAFGLFGTVLLLSLPGLVLGM